MSVFLAIRALSFSVRYVFSILYSFFNAVASENDAATVCFVMIQMHMCAVRNGSDCHGLEMGLFMLSKEKMSLMLNAYGRIESAPHCNIASCTRVPGSELWYAVDFVSLVECISSCGRCREISDIS